MRRGFCVMGLVAWLGVGLAGCPKAATSSSPSPSGATTAAHVGREARGEEGARCEAATECPSGMACVDNRVRCITAPCDAHFYECRSTCEEGGSDCPAGCTCETGTRATIDEGQAKVCDCPSKPSDAADR